jgi:hypothetical protein
MAHAIKQYEGTGVRTEFSKPTKRDAFERCEGLCEGILSSGDRCCANLGKKLHHFDHIIPDAIGGDNSLQNCQVLCKPCHDDKTRKIDIPIIAKAKRISDKHNGIRSPRQKIQSAGFRKASPQRSASRPIERRSYE